MDKSLSKFKIIFTYALFGFLWILYSDKLLATFIKDIETLNSIQTYKGWFFILITSLLLYYLIKRYEKQRDKIEKELRAKDLLLIQSSKMAAIGEMIDNIAHQWKQPLSMISIGTSGLKLRKSINDLDDETLIRTLDSILNSTEYLSNTIDDFRNFFNSNKEKKAFSLDSCINRVFLLIESKIKNRNIEIIKNINNYQIFGVENEIVQVLINIVNNSIDALEESNKKHKYIFIDSVIKENKVVILIKDNAGGIPKNIKSKIFESRFTTKKENKGTGIGLYMSKKIVENFNGTLDVENSKYQFHGEKYIGAQFIIKIPK